MAMSLKPLIETLDGPQSPDGSHFDVDLSSHEDERLEDGAGRKV